MQGHPRSVLRRLRRLSWAAGLLPSLLLLSGCDSAPTPDPPVLRFSAIPDQSAAQVLGQHLPLMARLCATVQRRCQWVPVDSYETLVERFGRGEIDIAYLGAATFAQSWERHGAVPLAMRDVDFRFTSVVVVRKSSDVHSLDDLRQRDFTFANRSSTSGHFMLRHRLAGENVLPERYFRSVQYAPNHDAAMREVVQGRADAAGVNATVFYRRVATADPTAGALRVVWQTPPFVDYVWAARQQLSAPLRRRLVDAFLDLDLSLPADRPALQAEGAAGFVPAFPHDFEEVRSVLRTQSPP